MLVTVEHPFASSTVKLYVPEPRTKFPIPKYGGVPPLALTVTTVVPPLQAIVPAVTDADNSEQIKTSDRPTLPASQTPFAQGFQTVYDRAARVGFLAAVNDAKRFDTFFRSRSSTGKPASPAG